MATRTIDQSLSYGTNNALVNNVVGYAGEDGYCNKRIQQIKKRYELDSVCRFDLGQNSDGCAPMVVAKLRRLLESQDVLFGLNRYPSLGKTSLKNQVAALHQVDPSSVCFSAGIEQAVGLIATAFLSVGDKVIVNQPSFFVFDNFSRRLGAIPVPLTLRECDNFDWTAATLDRLKVLLSQTAPKIIWLANPNNPTGRAIDRGLLSELLQLAAKQGTIVVLDEAYGEYIDPPGGVQSGSSLLADFPNLIVLRTFSKAFGLANLRVGYCLASDERIVRAIRAQGYNYPITQFSFELASTALDHLDFLDSTRQAVRQRREKLFHQLQGLPGLSVIETDCSIFMFKHFRLNAAQLSRRLEEHGVLVARIPGQGLVSQSYLRVSIGSEQDNERLFAALRRITCLERDKRQLQVEAKLSWGGQRAGWTRRRLAYRNGLS